MTLKYLPCISGLEGRLKYWISLQKKYFLLTVFYWTNQPTIRTTYRQNKSKHQEKMLLLFFLLKINPRHMLLSWQVYFKSNTMLSLCLLSIKKMKANKVSDKREMLIRKFYLYISCLTCRLLNILRLKQTLILQYYGVWITKWTTICLQTTLNHRQAEIILL